MGLPLWRVAGVAVASLLVATAARAQSQTWHANGTTVTIGAGIANLTLPDVPTMVTRGPNGAPFPVFESYQFSDNFGDSAGWSVNGSISVPITGFVGGPDELAVSGFWASIKRTEYFACGAGATICLISPLVDTPGVQQVNGVIAPGQSINSQATRDADQWSGSLEAKWFLNSALGAAKRGMKPQYLAVGADVRGIDQNLNAVMNGTSGFVANYNEDLNTTYYGGFIAWGGDYESILFRTIWDYLGLQSSFRFQGGVYYADTRYNGSLVNTGVLCGGCGNPTGNLSLSRNDVAFIGNITLETRKQINERMTLSLKSEYEYYSWVPSMAYNTVDRGPASITSSTRQDGTVINSDDAYSFRTTATLTVDITPH
jgi:hypothetical protein